MTKKLNCYFSGIYHCSRNCFVCHKSICSVYPEYLQWRCVKVTTVSATEVQSTICSHKPVRCVLVLISSFLYFWRRPEKKQTPLMHCSNINIIAPWNVLWQRQKSTQNYQIHSEITIHEIKDTHTTFNSLFSRTTR